MTSMELLNQAIIKVKDSSKYTYTPKEGPTVVAAYKAGEIYNLEEALYIIAELLTMLMEKGA